jgi:site-specific DNA-methyltransferase (adenine-specific)
MTRVEHIGNATLYLGDCREILPGLGKVDAVVTDPPYGIGFAHGGNDSSGIGAGRYATKFAKVGIVGDEAPFDPAPLLVLAADIILWGGNHFADKLPPSPHWLVWDKRAASGHTNDFADCELAWCSRKAVARVFRHQWDGMMRASERGVERVHPTQKPIELMKWCLERVVPTAATILDPYMGSGTTGVACAKLGRKFIGIEVDPKYFDIACRRIEAAYQQGDMFIPPPADKSRQEAMF